MGQSGKKALALAYLAMTAYAVPVGFTFLAVKASMGVGSSLQLLTFRFTAAFLAAGLLRAAGVIRRVSSPVPGAGKTLAFTSLTYVGFLGLQAFGLVYTTSIVSGILFAAVPIFTSVIAGVVLKEKSTGGQILFTLLSVLAVVAMFAIGARDELRAVSPVGFALLLVSSLSCAVSNVYMRVVKQYYPPLFISYVCCGTGCAVFWVLSLLWGVRKGGLAGFFEPLAHPGFLGAVLYLGVFCTLVTGALISYAMHTLPAVSATIFGNLSTAISVLAGAVLLQEPLYGYQVVCTVLIIVGVLGVSLCTGKPQADKGEGHGN